VVTENARNGHNGNHQTANLQDPLDAILVIHNVDAELPIVFVVIS
jgi:hypothetical protein